MAKWKADDRVVRSDQQVFSRVDGDVLMMSIQTGAYYGLDSVGSRIWELIEKPIEVSTLCSRLVEEYAVEPDVCEEHVLALLEQLAAEDLVARV